MGEMETRQTGKADYIFFRDKAQSFIKEAKKSLDDREWTPATVLAVHCVISSCDALTSKFLGKRYFGRDHSKVLELVRGVPFSKQELETKVKQISNVLGFKDISEYQARLIKEDEAKTAVIQSERIFEWVKQKVEEV